MILIVRYDEVALKGSNRPFFEGCLIKNIESCISCTASKLRGRILISTGDDPSKLKRVFGISSFSVCEVFDDLNDLSVEAIKKVKDSSSFAVRCQRVDKSFPKTSSEISKDLGSLIFEKTRVKVNLSNPEITVFVEIINKKLYLFFNKIPCFGGLPVGSTGNILGVLDSERDVLAALMLMRRGCSVFPSSDMDFFIKLINFFQPGQEKDNVQVFSRKKFIDENNIKAFSSGTSLDTFKELNFGALQLSPLVCHDDVEGEFELFKSLERC